MKDENIIYEKNELTRERLETSTETAQCKSEIVTSQEYILFIKLERMKVVRILGLARLKTHQNFKKTMNIYNKDIE
jgi:hypothetical protein